MRFLAAVMTALFVYLAAGFLSGQPPRFGTRMRQKPQVSRRQLWLIQAGSDLSPRQFLAGSILSGVLGFAFFRAIAGTWWVALIPSLIIAFLPYAYFSRQRAERLAAVQRAWPDGLREVLAYVNSGATLSAAVESLAERGPEPLREAFARYPSRSRMLGVIPALEVAKEELADPASDKVIEVLILAHQFGGSSLQVVLRDLIETMSADQRTAEEIRTAGFEQRLEGIVVAMAPWLILLFLATVPETYREFYRSHEGRFVVMIAAVWAAFGWVLMRIISKPREEIRVFGGGSTLSAHQDRVARS